MTDIQKVDAYIKKHSQWSKQLEALRIVFKNTELKEEIKWGSPTYTLNGKLIAGMAAFKNHYAIWFHQGVFLKDKQKKLLNAQEGVTRALRQWRFEKGDAIEGDLILAYLEESIMNSLAGKEIKSQPKKGINIPPILNKLFEENDALALAFKKLTPGKQREYANHIGSAKKVETQQNRLEKCKPMIMEGNGLHDKYKNC